MRCVTENKCRGRRDVEKVLEGSMRGLIYHIIFLKFRPSILLMFFGIGA